MGEAVSGEVLRVPAMGFPAGLVAVSVWLVREGGRVLAGEVTEHLHRFDHTLRVVSGQICVFHSYRIRFAFIVSAVTEPQELSGQVSSSGNPPRGVPGS